jgi:hypothetical protein
MKRKLMIVDDDRRGINLKDFQGFRSENGSSHGQILALTVLCVPSSLGNDLPPLLKVRRGNNLKD